MANARRGTPPAADTKPKPPRAAERDASRGAAARKDASPAATVKRNASRVASQDASRGSRSPSGGTRAARAKEARDERSERTELSILSAQKASAAAAKKAAVRKAGTPPADLTVALKTVWKRAHDELVRLGLWNDVVEPQLDQYVEAIAAAKAARAAATAEPFVEGSMGQLTPHPGYRLAEAHEAQAMRLAKALLLTPEARRRAGVKDDDGQEDALEALLRGDDET